MFNDACPHVFRTKVTSIISPLDAEAGILAVALREAGAHDITIGPPATRDGLLVEFVAPVLTETIVAVLRAAGELEDFESFPVALSTPLLAVA